MGARNPITKPRPLRKRFGLILLFVFGGLFLILLMLPQRESAGRRGSSTASIRYASAPIDVRERPGTEARVALELERNQAVRLQPDAPVKEGKYEWVKITATGGKEGWVPKNFLSASKPPLGRDNATHDD